MKLVDDVTGEEVSEMHARSVLVGILDPVTRQHTLHELLSHEALKKIVQEFAINSTTGQEAKQIGRFEAGATAPTTDWTPSVADTSEDSWEEYGTINTPRVHNSAGPAKETVTYPRTVPTAKAGQVRQEQGRIRMR